MCSLTIFLAVGFQRYPLRRFAAFFKFVGLRGQNGKYSFTIDHELELKGQNLDYMGSKWLE